MEVRPLPPELGCERSAYKRQLALVFVVGTSIIAERQRAPLPSPPTTQSTRGSLLMLGSEPLQREVGVRILLPELCGATFLSLNWTSRDWHVCFALLSLSVRQQQSVCTNLLWFGLVAVDHPLWLCRFDSYPAHFIVKSREGWSQLGLICLAFPVQFRALLSSMRAQSDSEITLNRSLRG